jgi:ribosomal protein S18 acetylase RimI-like enzyme
VKQGLEKSYGLNQTQLDNIQKLEAECNQFEGLTMKLNWNTLRRRPKDQLNDFFYTVDDIAVGYLALYGFGDTEVEISAMIAPNFRRQGIFKKLLVAAQEETRRRLIPDMLFICEQTSKSGAACANAIGAAYSFSEYKMDLQQQHTIDPLALPNGIQLRPAQPEDIPLLTKMDELCFGVKNQGTEERLAQELTNSNRKMLAVTLNGQVVGKIYSLFTNTETYVSAFCILPEHRGKGYGRAVLSQVVAELVAENRPNITLEVESRNDRALLLYKQCGFKTITAFDYYRLEA